MHKTPRFLSLNGENFHMEILFLLFAWLDGQVTVSEQRFCKNMQMNPVVSQDIWC